MLCNFYLEIAHSISNHIRLEIFLTPEGISFSELEKQYTTWLLEVYALHVYYLVYALHD